MIRPLLMLSSLAVPATAGDFSLIPPIDCDLAKACHIQQYVDHDAGPGARDFTCGPLSYDGHKGTDFALPDRAVMREGVAVLAAAAGTVRGLRDGMPDTGADSATAAGMEGRECGNGVLIAHADGWQTQYCHLRRGSLTVEKGQHVTAGTPLGLVGMSGLAEFPHVHLSVRHHGSVIDPFDPSGVIHCERSESNTLWQTLPAHRPGGIMSLGFADAVPSYGAIKDGTAAAAMLGPTSPALVIFGQFFGTRAGDTVQLSITGPDGTIIDHEVALAKNQAQSFRAAGKRKGRTAWRSGTYRGAVVLLRNGKPLESRSTSIEIR